MSDLVVSRRGVEYNLKRALDRNPTIIAAGDDICAIAKARILELEADNAILVEALQNMMGAFDTPIARRKISGAFAKEARDTAKTLLSKIDTGE